MMIYWFGISKWANLAETKIFLKKKFVKVATLPIFICIPPNQPIFDISSSSWAKTWFFNQMMQNTQVYMYLINILYL